MSSISRRSRSKDNSSEQSAKTPTIIRAPRIEDEQWEECKRQIWLRDAGLIYRGTSEVGTSWSKYCKIWKSLTPDEKKDCLELHRNSLWLNKTLDVAHIEAKGRRKDLYYTLDNLVLIGRFFHQRLTAYKHPVYNVSITPDKMKEIMRFAQKCS